MLLTQQNYFHVISREPPYCFLDGKLITFSITHLPQSLREENPTHMKSVLISPLPSCNDSAAMLGFLAEVTLVEVAYTGKI